MAAFEKLACVDTTVAVRRAFTNIMLEEKSIIELYDRARWFRTRQNSVKKEIILEELRGFVARRCAKRKRLANVDSYADDKLAAKVLQGFRYSL